MRRASFALALFSLALSIASLPKAARAQNVTVNIGSFGGETFDTVSASGTNAFVDSRPVLSGVGYSGSMPANGQGGNAIIVTPIVDPVVQFGHGFWNLTGSELISVTFRLPQFPVGDPRRTQLGFVNTPSFFGNGDTGAAFQITFLDPVGNYTGDYAPYLGQPVFSTVHFYRGAGTASIAPSEFGNFGYFAAYPAAQQGTSFFMDVVASSTNGSSTPNNTQFNTPGNPAGGIVIAPEPTTLALFGLGLIGLLRRRR